MTTNAVRTKKEIIDTVRKNQSRIRALGVSRLGLFGSFVHNKQNADSDIDLIVEFQPGQKSFRHFVRLSFLLEDLLGRRVELVTPESLGPYIGPYILREVEYVTVAA